MPSRPIVLASSSPHRRALLARLQLPFSVSPPALDETPRPGEADADLAARLALAKARAVAPRQPHALVIGSDQVAVLGGRRLGKPGDAAQSIAQLLAAAGQRIDFLTGLCLLDADSGRHQLDVVPYTVVLRPLERRQVESYVRRDRPFDCAGGFRAERLGIALFERTEGEDPTALIGLPLIRLVRMLAREGVDVLLEP